MRTAQQLFDTVVIHLRNQGQKSHIMEDPQGKWYGCYYRSPEGHKCAIGCLIPDADYSPEFEEKNLDKLLDQKLLPARTHNELSKHRELLKALQFTHDFKPISEWEMCWENIAKNHNLQFKKR